MRRIIVGVCTWLIAFAYFHAPNGDIIVVDTFGGPVIVRPSPPGYPPHTTMIQTGSGTVVVVESVCEVAHALEQHCIRDKVHETK